MANPAIVGTLSDEFYGLRDAGAIPSHAHLVQDDWVALCAWLDRPENSTTITLRWPVGKRKWRVLHKVWYHRQGAFAVQ